MNAFVDSNILFEDYFLKTNGKGSCLVIVKTDSYTSTSESQKF